jgi:hypothetical protein
LAGAPSVISTLSPHVNFAIALPDRRTEKALDEKNGLLETDPPRGVYAATDPANGREAHFSPAIVGLGLLQMRWVWRSGKIQER